MELTVDQYIKQLKKWREEIELLRSILLSCGLEESIKWKQPCYTLNQKNLIIIAPFKTHCDLGFFNGALLKDKNKILEKAGANTQASRQMRFTSVNDIVLQKTSSKAILKKLLKSKPRGLNLNLLRHQGLLL